MCEGIDHMHPAGCSSRGPIQAEAWLLHAGWNCMHACCWNTHATHHNVCIAHALNRKPAQAHPPAAHEHLVIALQQHRSFQPSWHLSYWAAADEAHHRSGR